jgi:enamine deaminase RidA (YjgF/YER057c/UK114 family)
MAKRLIAPIPPLSQDTSTAVRAGDLLFISGLMAMRDGSLLPESKVDPTQPFYAIPVKAELREILTQAEAICRDAGTSLKDAVRIQQFHTDLAEGRNGPLPLSPVEVPWLPCRTHDYNWMWGCTFQIAILRRGLPRSLARILLSQSSAAIAESEGDKNGSETMARDGGRLLRIVRIGRG